MKSENSRVKKYMCETCLSKFRNRYFDKSRTNKCPKCDGTLKPLVKTASSLTQATPDESD